MKKFFGIFIVLVLVSACFSGCGNASEGIGAHTSVPKETGEKDTVEPDNYNGETDKDEYNSGMFSEGRLYFHTSRKSALLVDSKGSLLWLFADNENFFDGFDSGDYVRAEHGHIMESYPGQTYVSEIEMIEDGDMSSFSDEEWERLSSVFVDGLERE